MLDGEDSEALSGEALSFIIARTLDAIAQHEDFDEPVLARVRELAASGDLTSFQDVMTALSDNQEK